MRFAWRFWIDFPRFYSIAIQLVFVLDAEIFWRLQVWESCDSGCCAAKVWSPVLYKQFRFFVGNLKVLFSLSWVVSSTTEGCIKNVWVLKMACLENNHFPKYHLSQNYYITKPFPASPGATFFVSFFSVPWLRPLHKRRGILLPPGALRVALQKWHLFPLFCCVCDLWTSVILARVQGEVPRELLGARETPLRKMTLWKWHLEITCLIFKTNSFGRHNVKTTSEKLSWNCFWAP